VRWIGDLIGMALFVVLVLLVAGVALTIFNPWTR
jgi:hypothetical protein